MYRYAAKEIDDSFVDTDFAPFYKQLCSVLVETGNRLLDENPDAMPDLTDLGIANEFTASDESRLDRAYDDSVMGSVYLPLCAVAGTDWSDVGCVMSYIYRFGARRSFDMRLDENVDRLRSALSDLDDYLPSWGRGAVVVQTAENGHELALMYGTDLVWPTIAVQDAMVRRMFDTIDIEDDERVRLDALPYDDVTDYHCIPFEPNLPTDIDIVAYAYGVSRDDVRAHFRDPMFDMALRSGIKLVKVGD